MENLDLSKYDLGGLKSLQAEIEKAIKGRQQDEVKKAREQILSIAQSLGLSVEELLAKNGAKSNDANGKKAQPRYQNPADNSQTWTGRGRQPKWIAGGLANGKTLDDFRI